ncbi:cyclodeaminase/cyclohydrolase family protein [Tumebacillus sp. DT12]|uniref:Cyclodeaminase/cyclohydrolase family protein n=1 Tax=Tumebacillus lacus TaxID=2995335 RepID=A0ABT3WX43_9BACL|nr:cyclodeaminase/cyclohydrolase family protein [Tumebacillus lacus]MCX7569248.1 cyclodeaminase/cyclohydrolase family protein [Tumebacillus lacus]
MNRIRQGRFVDEPMPSLCDWIAHPDVPSPAGGTVVALCAALSASLLELITRVTRNRLEKKGEGVADLDQRLAEILALRQTLLDYGEADVYEAQKIIQGERAACVRHDVGSPAKIAGHIVKLLRQTDELTPHVPVHLHSDLRVVAFLGHAAVMGITEIALANIRSAGGADDKLLARIDTWRDQATLCRDRIVSHS